MSGWKWLVWAAFFTAGLCAALAGTARASFADDAPPGSIIDANQTERGNAILPEPLQRPLFRAFVSGPIA